MKDFSDTKGQLLHPDQQLAHFHCKNIASMTTKRYSLADDHFALDLYPRRRQWWG